MRKNAFLIAVMIFGFLVSTSLQAQRLLPRLTFDDEPRTHNVHIACDGQEYYTVNGGKQYEGQISKFTLEGKWVASYDIDLDMRSIMYNSKDKMFYVCTYDKNIYKITDIQKGQYELVLSGIYDNEQANLALSPSGKLLYYFDNGTLKIYKFPSGKLSKTINGFDCGKEFNTGSCSVAVDSKYIYTWNSEHQLLYAYDLKGKKIKTTEIANGDYGFSLSYANGLVFVSKDGDYSTGTWFGYAIWAQ